jgi:hypothetical protein
MSYDLLEGIFDDAPKYSNFFNGRLLTAEDLGTEQAYAHKIRGYLGQALGSGVVEGLTVTVPDVSPPQLQVAKGLALSPIGQPLVLGADITLDLVRTTQGTGTSGGFHDCGISESSGVLGGVGFYVLVMGPATGTKDKVAVVGEPCAKAASACGKKYKLDGVYFNLVQLDISPFFEVNQASNLTSYLAQEEQEEGTLLNYLRSWVAHYCFGTANMLVSPWTLSTMLGDLKYGAIDELYRNNLIRDCEVPLGVFLWTQSGIEYFDMFPVRRRPAPMGWTDGHCAAFGPRYRIECESLFRQFQTQLSEITGTLDEVRAFDYFAYLPPAGIISEESGIDWDKFFEGYNKRQEPREISPDMVLPIIRRSFDYLPFNSGKRQVNVYRIVLHQYYAGNFFSPPFEGVLSTLATPNLGQSLTSTKVSGISRWAVEGIEGRVMFPITGGESLVETESRMPNYSGGKIVLGHLFTTSAMPEEGFLWNVT